MPKKANRTSFSCAVIPDTQVRAGHSVDHLRAAGNYIADHRPEVIVHLGDHWDMHSLSVYDKGKMAAEGADYSEDINAGNVALDALMRPIEKKRGYNPKKIFLIGNHEERILRHIEANPILRNTLGYKDFNLKTHGFSVVPFLVPIVIGGVTFAHYFYNPNTGKPYCGHADNMLTRIGFSFTQGHQQGKKIAERSLGNGATQRALVIGSYYPHDEQYRGPQANSHWRGFVMKHEMGGGDYCLLELSLKYMMQTWA